MRPGRWWKPKTSFSRASRYSRPWSTRSSARKPANELRGTAMTEHEIELKRLLLGEGAGERLLAALGRPASAQSSQVNHVLDTKTFALRASRHTLRVRDEDGRWVLTAKGPSRSVGAF